MAAFLLAIGACLTEPPEDTAARLRQTQGIEAAIAFLESQTGLDEETRHRVEAALRELRLTAVRETWAQLAAADPEVSRLDPATFEAMLLRLQSCGPFGPDEKRLYGDIVQVLAGVYQARGECERAYRILAGGYDFTADTGLISEAARTLSRCKDAAYVDRQFTALLERFKENLAVRELYADVLVKRQELPRAIALFEVLRQHPDASPTDRLRYTALLSTLRQWGATGAVQAQPPASPTSVTAPPKP